MNTSCVDAETKQYPRPAAEVVPVIDEIQCANLQAFIGINGDKNQNCDDLAALVCDIKQEVDALNIEDAITIAANDASKCADDDLPTLASIFSRILRYLQASSCILCAYDPRLSTILKTGRYPQILFGSLQEGGYPQWIAPDKTPTEDSQNPVTSAGIYKAIQDAILSVWHLWEEEPEFTYFAQTLDELNGQMADAPASNGDTALVASADGKTSLLYTYTNGAWKLTRQLTAADDNLTNFAVTHIVKGKYATNGVYYFDGTWQVMDTDMSELEAQVDELKKTYDKSVLSTDTTSYVLTTRPTLADAKAVACTAGRDTIVLVTG